MNVKKTRNEKEKTRSVNQNIYKKAEMFVAGTNTNAITNPPSSIDFVKLDEVSVRPQHWWANFFRKNPFDLAFFAIHFI